MSPSECAGSLPGHVVSIVLILSQTSATYLLDNQPPKTVPYKNDGPCLRRKVRNRNSLRISLELTGSDFLLQDMTDLSRRWATSSRDKARDLDSHCVL